jgi:hypothetical protein
MAGNMDHQTIKMLIQKYRGQVESLNATIRTLEAELGEQPGANSQTGQEDHAGTNQGSVKPPRHPSADPLADVREWQFFNKSQPDGAEELLELVGHPLSIGVLLDGLEKGGAKIGGKTPAEKKQNLATVLARSGRFGRAARGTWGLPNWPHITPVKRGDEAEPEGKGNGTDEASA